MTQESQDKFLIFSEGDDVVPELLSKARGVANPETTLICVYTGKDAEKKAAGYIAFGADMVFVNGDTKQDKLQVEAYSELMHQVANQQKPSIIIIGATKFGNELASRLAQSLDTGCATDCLDFDLDGSNVKMSRLYYGGKFIAKQVFKTSPAVITIPPRRFETLQRNEDRKGKIVHIGAALIEPKARIIDVRPKEQGSVQIEKADVIVGVGRGLKKKEDLAIIEELAQTVGGVVGGSRPVTEDLQWLPSDVQIGLSGKKVKPKLYIACGISGQIQHLVGMRDAKIVVAINVDEQAPIMQEADYCIVFDLYKFVPALNKAVKELLHK